MMYLDDYNILDVSYIIHACLVDPCAEHPDDHPWLIGVLLGLGKKGERCTLAYPTRTYRDTAFEQICAMIRAEQGLLDEEEEEPRTP